MAEVANWSWGIAAFLSAAGFVLGAFDKVRAQRGRHRVRERTLFLTALAGGSLGLFLAMVLFRHKVRKPSFLARLLGIVAVQFAAVYLWLGP